MKEMTIAATFNDFYNFPRNYVNVSSSVNEKKTKTFFCTLLLHLTIRVQHLVYVNGFKSS